MTEIIVNRDRFEHNTTSSDILKTGNLVTCIGVIFYRNSPPGKGHVGLGHFRIFEGGKVIIRTTCPSFSPEDEDLLPERASNREIDKIDGLSHDQREHLKDVFRDSVEERMKTFSELKEIVDIMNSDGEGDLHCFVFAEDWNILGKGEFLSWLRRYNVIFDEKYCKMDKIVVNLRVFLQGKKVVVRWSSSPLKKKKYLELHRRRVRGEAVRIPEKVEKAITIPLTGKRGRG